MASKTIGAFLAAAPALALALATPLARAGDALTIRAVRPDEQGERLIGLFRGARVPHPAAALAAWKRAGGGKATLGKPLEAAIAALNPAMLRELKSLDRAELRLGFAAGTGRLDWRAVVPNDDGSLAAIGTALALTDGGAEPPLDGADVLRLGPPGAALSASAPGRLVLASTREGLKLALDGADALNDDRDPGTGLHARLDPAGLRPWKTVSGRRLFEALDALGCRAVLGRLAFEGDDAAALQIRSEAAKKPRPPGNRALDPAWLDAVPASGTLAAVSVAVDTGAESLALAFAVLDRVERADPARAGLAPLRTRLNVLASAARVRPEVDLWPRLRGVTAAVLVDDIGAISGAIVALHCVDDADAGRVSNDVLARLASAFLPGGTKPATGDAPGALGTVAGKPLSKATRGSRVVVGWGEGALSAALAAIEAPGRSAGPALRASWGASPPDRAGGFWPGRLATAGSPLADALNLSPPVVWEGRTTAGSTLDVVRWAGLRDTLRRWLDALPLDPPPDAETR